VVGVDGPGHADVLPALAGLAEPRAVDLARFVLSGVLLLLLVHPDSRARIEQLPAACG
jgi:hypothetical protein